MKRFLALLCVTLASCATAGDIQELNAAHMQQEARVDAALEKLEKELEEADGQLDAQAVAVDKAKQTIQAAKHEFTKKVDDVAQKVEDRTEDGLGSLAQQGGIAGLVVTVGGVLLHNYRNYTRKRDLLNKTS